MKNKKTLIIVVVFIVLIVGASVLYNFLGDKVEKESLSTQEQKSENESKNASAEQKETEQNSLAPDFTVTDENGNQYKLSDFVGKPVILNFWASWCGPCKSEMPDFDEAYKKYKDEINFMMINLTDGSRETVGTASSYIEEQGYSFPVYYDTLSEVTMTYSVYSVPTTYFIDKNGNIIANAQGAIDSETLQKGIGMIYSE